MINKIAFITGSPQAPASVMYWEALKNIEKIFFFNGLVDLTEFDIVLLMTYDHYLVKKIRIAYPHVKVAIIDPRSYSVLESAKLCDFLIVDSIEMEDYWRRADIPIFRYSEYPSFPEVKKIHKRKEKIIIGYHGNKVHLACMYKTITPALSELGKKYDLELMVMYNGRPPSSQEIWYPKNIKVTHIQWGKDKYLSELSKCDIGISPNSMPFKENPPYAHDLRNNINYSPDDYILRFKMPTNPGRILVFGKLGIPTIADFYPSAFEVLSDRRGFTCKTKHAWKFNLEKLILDYKLRQTTADNLQQYIRKIFDFDKQNQKFLNFLETQIL